MSGLNKIRVRIEDKSYNELIVVELERSDNVKDTILNGVNKKNCEGESDIEELFLQII